MLLGILGWIALVPATVQAIDRVNVMIGYYDSKPNEKPKRVDLGDVAYYLDIATFPITPADRRVIRTSPVFYINQMPDGAEFFRDDMEAFHKMIYDGGVLILLAGPDSPENTIKSFNYLGTRFDFEYSAKDNAAGEIIPELVGKGPLGGNVWLCNKGARTLKLDHNDWYVHYRWAKSNAPVMASRRIGNGMLVIGGTLEVDRQSSGQLQNALTLIAWGMQETKLPPRERASIQTPLPNVPLTNIDQPPLAIERFRPLTESEMANIIAHPSSDLLKDRLYEMRRVYALTLFERADDNPEFELIPTEQRKFFPPIIAPDIYNRTFDMRDYASDVVLVVAWATWDMESRTMIKTNADLFNYLQERQGVVIVGISLDKSIDTLKEFQQEAGIHWVQLCDGESYNSPIAKALNIKEVPRLFLVDKAGRICKVDLSIEDLRNAIRKARLER